MIRSTIAGTIMITGVGLLPVVVSPQPLAAATGTCAPTTSKYLTATNDIFTTSFPFVTVGGTTINFVQGGTTASCIIVSFSGEASAEAATIMLVQPVIDGAAICQPGPVEFAASFATQRPAAPTRLPSSVPVSHRGVTRSKCNTAASTKAMYIYSARTTISIM